jgi:hypothetical protein
MSVISDLTTNLLAATYRRHGREAFFRACDELVNEITALREHEERKAQAGLPLEPGTNTDGHEAWLGRNEG